MDENNIEQESAEGQAKARRPYEPPAVRDFFQPLVVLGTGTSTFGCATPKPPKHPR